MQIEKIRIGDLTLNEKNIRKDLNVDDLVDSISESGVIVPLIVTPDGVVIDGNRRLEAARQVFGENAFITAEVKDLSEQEIIEYSLITALQRENLSEKEKAEAYNQLHIMGMSDLAIAKKIGKKKVDVKSYIKAASASEEAWETHSLEELQYIAEYPELINMHGVVLKNAYSKKKADERALTWLDTLELPFLVNTTGNWFDDPDSVFDGTVIKQDNKVYENGVAVGEYAKYDFAPFFTAFLKGGEVWLIGKRIADEEVTPAVNELNQRAIATTINAVVAEEYEKQLDIWNALSEKIYDAIKECKLQKEPALSAVKVVAMAYGFTSFTAMLTDAFENISVCPCLISPDGELVYRECEAKDLIDALLIPLTPAERSLINGGK